MNQIKDQIMSKLTCLLLLFSLISCKSTKSAELNLDLLAELHSLKYFEYTDSEIAKKISLSDIVTSLSSNLVFEIYDELSFEPQTKRNYIIDGEFLSDNGGIDSFLMNELLPFYKSSGFKLEIMDHKIEFDPTTFKRREEITVNGREYQIFDGESTKRAEGWYIAPLRMTKLINEELRIQGLKERFYLINSGNDLTGVFLTELQYGFFKQNIKDKYLHPQTLKSWINLYNVEIDL